MKLWYKDATKLNMEAVDGPEAGGATDCDGQAKKTRVGRYWQKPVAAACDISAAAAFSNIKSIVIM